MEIALEVKNCRSKCTCGEYYYDFFRGNLLKNVESMRVFVINAIMQQLECKNCCFEKTLCSFRNLKVTNMQYYGILNDELQWEKISAYKDSFPELQNFTVRVKSNIFRTFLSTGNSRASLLTIHEVIDNIAIGHPIPEEWYPYFVKSKYPELSKFGGEIFRMKAMQLGVPVEMINYILK